MSEELGGMREAAAILGCSVATARRLAREGTIPSFRLSPGGWRRIDLAEVRKLRDELRAAQAVNVAS